VSPWSFASLHFVLPLSYLLPITGFPFLFLFRKGCKRRYIGTAKTQTKNAQKAEDMKDYYTQNMARITAENTMSALPVPLYPAYLLDRDGNDAAASIKWKGVF
jgi:hypothetical protein